MPPSALQHFLSRAEEYTFTGQFSFLNYTGIHFIFFFVTVNFSFVLSGPHIVEHQYIIVDISTRQQEY